MKQVCKNCTTFVPVFQDKNIFAPSHPLVCRYSKVEGVFYYTSTKDII